MDVENVGGVRNESEDTDGQNTPFHRRDTAKHTACFRWAEWVGPLSPSKNLLCASTLPCDKNTNLKNVGGVRLEAEEAGISSLSGDENYNRTGSCY